MSGGMQGLVLHDPAPLCEQGGHETVTTCSALFGLVSEEGLVAATVQYWMGNEG